MKPGNDVAVAGLPLFAASVPVRSTVARRWIVASRHRLLPSERIGVQGRWGGGSTGLLPLVLQPGKGLMGIKTTRKNVSSPFRLIRSSKWRLCLPAAGDPRLAATHLQYPLQKAWP
jgi:hypothetical protein